MSHIMPVSSRIDPLAVLQKNLDRALFLYNFIREARCSGMRASITIGMLEDSAECGKLS